MIEITRTFYSSNAGTWHIETSSACAYFTDEDGNPATSGVIPIAGGFFNIIAIFENTACLNAFSGKLKIYNEDGRLCNIIDLSYAGYCDFEPVASVVSDRTNEFVLTNTTPGTASQIWKWDSTIFKIVEGQSNSDQIRLKVRQPFTTSVVRLIVTLENGCSTFQDIQLTAPYFAVEATDVMMAPGQDPVKLPAGMCQYGVSFVDVMGTIDPDWSTLSVSGLVGGVTAVAYPDEQLVRFYGPSTFTGSIQVTISIQDKDHVLTATKTIVVVGTICTTVDPVTSPSGVILITSQYNVGDHIATGIVPSTLGPVDWTTFTVVSQPSHVSASLLGDDVYLELLSAPPSEQTDPFKWKVQSTAGVWYEFTWLIHTFIALPVAYGNDLVCGVCTEYTDPVDLTANDVNAQPGEVVFVSLPSQMVPVFENGQYKFLVKMGTDTILNFAYRAYRLDGVLDDGQGIGALVYTCAGKALYDEYDVSCQQQAFDLKSLLKYNMPTNVTYQYSDVNGTYTAAGGTIDANGNVDFTNIGAGTYIFEVKAILNFSGCPALEHSVLLTITKGNVGVFPGDTVGQAIPHTWPTVGGFLSQHYDLRGQCPTYAAATQDPTPLPAGWTAAGDIWFKMTANTNDILVQCNSILDAQNIQMALYDANMVELAQDIGANGAAITTTGLGIGAGDIVFVRVMPATPGVIRLITKAI
ncbi:MAG: hypothetical protein D6746_08625 [Bacteroidetes bacterium]|nr:MAG: hypothetical protein D6746_08625 [Bacteroidota bacterium]